MERKKEPTTHKLIPQFTSCCVQLISHENDLY